MSRHVVGFSLASLLTSFLFTDVAAQVDTTTPPVDSATAAAIGRLFAVTRVGELFIRGMEMALDGEKDANPDMPPIFYDEFIKKAKADTARFFAMLTPMYAELLTLREIEDLIAFYATPLGKRLLELESEMALRMEPIGEQWGMMVAAETMLDLAKRGIVIK